MVCHSSLQVLHIKSIHTESIHIEDFLAHHIHIEKTRKERIHTDSIQILVNVPSFPAPPFSLFPAHRNEGCIYPMGLNLICLSMPSSQRLPRAKAGTDIKTKHGEKMYKRHQAHQKETCLRISSCSTLQTQPSSWSAVCPHGN